MQPLCLTFDNGPEPEVTPGVLATLARRGIPATFFLVGDKLRDPAGLALANRARAEGHRVGNHTLTQGTPRRRSPRSSPATPCSARCGSRSGCSARMAAAARSGRIC